METFLVISPEADYIFFCFSAVPAYVSTFFLREVKKVASAEKTNRRFSDGKDVMNTTEIVLHCTGVVLVLDWYIE